MVMVSIKRNSSTNRASFMMMKLLHIQGTKNNKDRTTPSYFKWVLCISLFLYFYTSYYISISTDSIIKGVPPSKTTLLGSRALIENTIRRTNGYDLKIYVYDLPSRYNKDWLSNQRCRTHLFAAEVAIHQALLGSGFRTLDPLAADFFFVPVYVSCDFNTSNGFPSMDHARPLLSSAVHFVASEMPFWNRSDGSDHVFVASHDYGACFHAVEELAISDGIPEFLKKSIVLQTFGVKSRHTCQEVEHVLIPPYVSTESVRSTLEKVGKKAKRDIWAFFRGKMEIHPKSISGRFYGKGVRTAIWKKYSHNRKFHLKRGRSAGYQAEMARSVFCLCPLGWAPWSPRLVESVALGCVPVIISDGIRLPFPSSVPWPDISLTVAEKDVGKLARILDHVAATNLSAIQRKLWDPAIRRALLYSETLQSGDATWHILDELSRRVRQREMDTWR